VLWSFLYQAFCRWFQLLALGLRSSERNEPYAFNYAQWLAFLESSITSTCWRPERAAHSS
jgi:hypothetical protein